PDARARAPRRGVRRLRPRPRPRHLLGRRAVGLPRDQVAAAVSGAELGARLRERDLTAAPAALNLIENRTPAAREQVAALLAEVSPSRIRGEAPGRGAWRPRPP